MQTSFALLDDCGSTPGRPTSRLCTGFTREHRCTNPAELDFVWGRVEADQRQGLHAVLLVDYEWGAKLLHAGQGRLAASDASSLRVLMFRDCAKLSADEVGAWLETAEAADASHMGGLPQPAGVTALQPDIDEAAFTDAIARIHEAIAAGETYQVNFTYRLHGHCYGSPVALYRRLRERQPVAYGALIALPAGEETTHVLSCSPELFLRNDGGVLTARPMKGTAARADEAASDGETARRLAVDAKNRAENVMIVDLLRNDIGRVARTGSVKVPALFAVEPYATVFQMTSTVEAALRPEVGMPALLRATFPCGSITGAPKHRTMEWIAQLEGSLRGLYCGAIGWVDAPTDGAAVGDFCLSVAIRTLTLGAPVRGLRPLRMGVGAGIVQDSRATDEFEECRLKARFLAALDPGFELFETMLATPAGGIRYLDRHLARLAHSAQALGFAFDHEAAVQALRDALPALAPGQPSRLRLALAHGGRMAITHSALPPLPPGAVKLVLAGERLPDANPLGAFKTTWRQHYDAGVRAAEQAGAFDSLFFTADGRLVEGGRSTLFARIDGRWWTPPVADGALPGVMRGVLMEDAIWQPAERSLSLDDLRGAQKLVVCNALRGVLPAQLVHDTAHERGLQPLTPAPTPTAAPPTSAPPGSRRPASA
ncbi:para-aminobenzoate synthetase/4-amino-4-deoxychorismate lyase [Variovorax sp. TBS-050B]|uniref:aminodeoxychorismate synthase component I n=1 Tax=Variovorax sp. TBS-050B TaxID=2940551 RepID=UPI002474AC44|nr:aminodeoxychorismate synthase component I [Variovorax sp. TBS-050B]MDH6594123.1 para-aminobenzoate synthetase/4-amino-4-deoxychorismate lyase [Variovorax sp. TBS-050B]